VYAVTLQGVVCTVAGLIQGNVALMVCGIVAILLSLALVVVTYVVAPVHQGEIVVRQQPQLTDVRTHVRRTKELAQVS
jgi:hypothetical protein